MDAWGEVRCDEILDTTLLSPTEVAEKVVHLTEVNA
jgi:hypothetical protein